MQASAQTQPGWIATASNAVRSGGVGALVITAYFLYFAVVVVPHVKFQWFPDSFRYAWEGDISRYFFLGNSFSVRATYMLLGNKELLITYLQYFLLYLSALVFFFTLKTQSRFANVLAGIVIVLVYDTPEFRGPFYAAMPESAFAHLMLIFSVLVFGARRTIWSIVAGFLLAFSRAVGPYVVLGQLALYALMYKPSVIMKKLVILILPLAIIGGASLYLSQQYDTATNQYVAANVWKRILPFENKTRFFIEHYGLPEGPYLDTCKGGNILWHCVDYQLIYSGDHVTRNYSLLQDDYGYADWVRAVGPGVWQNYVLFEDTANTWREFKRVVPRYFSRLWIRDEYRVFKLDPYGEFRTGLESLGMSGLVPILSLLGIGFVLYYAFGRSRQLRVALVLSCSGLGAVFVGYFGDALGIERHVWPGYVVLHAGMFAYFWSIPAMVQGWRAQRRSRHEAPREAL